MEDQELMLESLLTEILDLNSAKYFDFQETPANKMPGIPTLKFQTEFVTDKNKEYAFRVLRKPEIGRNSRWVFVSIRAAGGKLKSQDLMFDVGDMKKILVTLLKSYQLYKESPDGHQTSSYDFTFPAKYERFAPFIVKVIQRAFKTEPRAALDLAGAVAEKTVFHLYYTNRQSTVPFFGGKDFDPVAVKSNPFYASLVKATPPDAKSDGSAAVAVAVANQIVTATTPTPVVALVAPVVNTTPKVDAVDPMNNPTAFNDSLFNRLHFAKGRDDFAAILRDVRVHRKYMQDHFEPMFNALYVSKPLDQMFANVNMKEWDEGMGFYLKRYDVSAYSYIKVHAAISVANVPDMVKALGDVPKELAQLRSSPVMVNSAWSVAKMLAGVYSRVCAYIVNITSDTTAQSSFLADQRLITGIINGMTNASFGNTIAAVEAYLADSQTSIADGDRIKSALVLYFYSMMTASMAVDIVRAYASNPKVRTLPNGDYNVDDIDSLFTNSAVIIDALDSLFTSRTMISFGAYSGPEDGILTQFKLQQWTNFQTSIRSTGLYDKDVLGDMLVSFIKGASSDFIDETLDDIISSHMFGYTVTDLRKIVQMAYADRIASLPDTENLTLSIEQRLYALFVASPGSPFVPGATIYFRKRVQRLYDVALIEHDNYSYGDDAFVKRIQPIGIDMDAYVRNIARTVVFGQSSFFISTIIVKGLAKYLTSAQLDTLLMAGIITNDGLMVMYYESRSKVVLDKYNERVGIMTLLNNNTGRMYGTTWAMSKALYNISSDAVKAEAAVKLLKDLATFPNEVADILGTEVVSEHVITDPTFNYRYNAAEVFAVLNAKASDAAIARTAASGRVVAVSSIIDGLNRSGNMDKLSKASYESLFASSNSYFRGTKPSQRREFEDANAQVVVSAWNSDPKVGEALFNQLTTDDKKIITKSVIANKFVAVTRDALAGDHVPIKPLVDLDEKRILDILKYNNIKVPRAPKIDDNATLTDVMSKTINKSDINTLAVTEVPKTAEELEQMSVEYDAFNRYRHGNIAAKIVRAFDVSIPIQDAGYAAWTAKMAAEGTNSKIMRPVFHGTGTVAASMILRYGFRVIKSNDPSVAGRMLGDGIYFSNVIDKVSQYMSDGRMTRGLGAKGYIFEMEASLGQYDRDFKAAGPGTGYSETSVISPEWAVFNVNEQVKIYRAYQCELIDKDMMSELKSKHGINENTTAVGIKHFKGFINEALGGSMNRKNKVVYIFMDGTVPVSKVKSVEFEDFDAKKFGSHVHLDWSGSGPTVQFDTNGEGGVFCIRYTNQFMHDGKQIDKFIALLNEK